MSPELQQQARGICEQALSLPEDRREVFITLSCAGRPELEAEVRRMIAIAPGSESAVPASLGRYRIDSLIGGGGMSRVYKAWDTNAERYLAVKAIRIDGMNGFAANRESLLGELKLSGKLEGIPGIVGFYDAAVDDHGGIAYLAMELVEGPSLDKTMVAGFPVETDLALNILRQSAATLDMAHSRGIVHCDIKPANLLIQGSRTVTITDFGISRVRDPGKQAAMAPATGTLDYISPEQIGQSKLLNERTDQYSLAVVAFQLLTGHLPFESAQGGHDSLLFAILTGDRPSARWLNSSLPMGIDEPLKRGMAIEATHRFDTCSAFVDALIRPFQLIQSVPPATFGETIPTHPDDLRRAGVWQPGAPEGRKIPSYIYALLIFAVLTIGGAAMFYRTMPSPSKAAPRAAAIPAPSITRFSAEPARIKPGESSRLYWDVKDADYIIIDQGIGKVGPSGSFEVRPDAGTSYMLNATGKGGDNFARTDVGVSAVDPVVPPRTGMLASKDAPAHAQPNPRSGGESGSLKPAETAMPAQPSAESEALLRQGKKQLVDRDETGARETLRKAADGGNTEAMVLLGAMYSQGVGGPKNDSEAVRMFEQSAGAGNIRGMYNLGHMYANGQGVKKSQTEAANWYAKAVNGGSADAAFRLAMMYEQGVGVPMDLNEAKELYQKAGTPEAKSQLLRLAQRPPQSDANASPEAPSPLRIPLILHSISPAVVRENQLVQYTLAGSGFSLASDVRTDMQGFVGSRPGKPDNHPFEVGPQGRWLKIYLNIPAGGRQSVRITVKNPDGQEASLQASTEK